MRWRLASKMQLVMALTMALFMVAVFGFLAHRQEQRGLEALRQQARTMADEMVIVRQCLADRGGVWVRDPSGRYTDETSGFYLKVPAVVISELSTYNERAGSFNMRITSLRPVNPANAPDPFEREALELFANRGVKEVTRLEKDASGYRNLRYARALYVEESCLKCHAQQGYRLGDVRGALSLSVPAEEALAVIRRDLIFYIILGLGAFAAILLANGLTIWRLVAVPLHKVEVAARSLAVGYLETRVEINSRDELQLLGESFNHMAAQLSKSYLTLERLVDENLSMEAERRQLKEAVARDGLTGLYNHRHFRERLRAETARSLREGSPLSLLMADIDRFKHYNDSYGHLAGDKVLAAVARVIEDAVRVSDIAARYGGEEFAVILPNTDTAAALATAERIRLMVERTPMDVGASAPVHVTISIGVASLSSQHADEEFLIQAADAALYAAKKAGRNRVVVAGQP